MSVTEIIKNYDSSVILRNDVLTTFKFLKECRDSGVSMIEAKDQIVADYPVTREWFWDLQLTLHVHPEHEELLKYLPVRPFDIPKEGPIMEAACLVCQNFVHLDQSEMEHLSLYQFCLINLKRVNLFDEDAVKFIDIVEQDSVNIVGVESPKALAALKNKVGLDLLILQGNSTYDSDELLKIASVNPDIQITITGSVRLMGSPEANQKISSLMSYGVGVHLI